MAVLDKVPGIEVTVQINGQDVVEYNDPDASEFDATFPTSSKYIECVDDAEFAVQYHVTNEYKWGYKDHFDDSRHERVKEDVNAAKHLGLIEIKVLRATFKGYSTKLKYSKHTEPNTLEFAEKSLKGKAISHGVSTSFAPASPVGQKRFVDTKDLPEDGGPIAVFQSLKREMIIPRSPSHSPTLASMSRAELERLAQERLDQLRAQNEVKEESRPVIKGESGSTVKQESRSAAKREVGQVYDLTRDSVSPRPKKHPRRGTGAKVEIVDLTDD
ncbi:hypothetical protein SLS62_001324 [Diatrype stigma]|uniref:DUF7918 domain-containing protein n=1 Tax=Diatrype stigma TaxID=117547 RepID=A0AAN9V1R8_9PEZI